MTAATPVALAEDELVGEPTGYVSTGAIIGQDRFEYGGIEGEVGRRIGRTPLFGRAMAHAGNLKLEGTPGRGTYVEARGGIEARRCGGDGRLCLSLGIDLGVHSGNFEPSRRADPQSGKPRPASIAAEVPREEDGQDSVVAVPRLTVDGGGRVRIRTVLELPSRLGADDQTVGFALTFGLGLAY